MNNKFRFIRFIALSACPLFIFEAQAFDGTVKFTGNILDAACIVDIGENSTIPVPLGDIQKSSFTGDGSLAATTKFTVKLKSCPAGVDQATVKFSGTSYQGDDNFIQLDQAADVATGVAIQIKDATQTIVPLMVDSQPYTLLPDVVNDLDFYASYVQKGTTVVKGTANATVNFTVDYQ
ncbi:fimbrial protein [Citrobacter sp. R56]|uniref:fimbrial protein n=1 Tax=Citrobacter sp. R56 TaxID=1573676 RepID=UPI001078AF29|nr:fimbrial protein [Citrobacter sp. R56]QRG78047.1 fimbrial protein [Citrobacter sp. R56]